MQLSAGAPMLDPGSIGHQPVEALDEPVGRVLSIPPASRS
jgi:hypothetical protein